MSAGNPRAAGTPLRVRVSDVRVGGVSEVDRWGRRFTAAVVASWAAGFAFGFTTGLTVLTILGLVAAAAGLRRPIVGLFGVGILCALDAATRVFLLTGGLLRFNTVNYLLLVVTAFNIQLLFHRAGPPTKLLALLLAVMAIGLAWSTDVMDGVQHILNATCFFGLLVYFIRVGRNRRVWYWLALINGTLGGIGGLLFLLQTSSTVEIINPNAWAHFPLAALFSICLAVAIAPRAGQFLLPALAVVNSAWVLLTGSRGGILIALLCLVFLGTRALGPAGRVALTLTTVLVALLVTSAFADREAYAFQRIRKILDSGRTLAERTSGRSDIVKVGWRLFLGNPLMGVGTGGFASRWARVDDVRGLSKRGVSSEVQAHSGWIKTLAENGLPGFLAHAAFVLSFAFVGWKHRRGGLFLPGLLVSAVLSVAFLSTEFQNKGIWFLAAGAAALLQREGSVSARPEPLLAHGRPSRWAVRARSRA